MLVLKFTRTSKPVFTFRGKTGKVIETIQNGGSSVIAAVVGPPGANGSAGNISNDANNGLTTGNDGGLYVTNAVDLGTFN
jgi:hypothetical protein|tara:strand:- start:59 stop:298 length:240 start_codon:yes stop_codon:yes gene_type:complete